MDETFKFFTHISSLCRRDLELKEAEMGKKKSSAGSEQQENYSEHRSMEKGVFKCCGKTFHAPSHYERHLSFGIHASTRFCPLCQESVPKDHYETHLAAAHGRIGNTYYCSICKEPFSNRNGRDRHESTIHGTKKFECAICGKLCSRKDILAKHLRKHDVPTSKFNCDLCDATFSHYMGFHSHLRNIHRANRLMCPKCSLVFPTESELKEHKKTHEFKYTCMMCGKSFNRPGKREIHYRYHLRRANIKKEKDDLKKEKAKRRLSQQKERKKLKLTQKWKEMQLKRKEKKMNPPEDTVYMEIDKEELLLSAAEKMDFTGHESDNNEENVTLLVPEIVSSPVETRIESMELEFVDVETFTDESQSPVPLEKQCSIDSPKKKKKAPKRSKSKTRVPARSRTKKSSETRNNLSEIVNESLASELEVHESKVSASVTRKRRIEYVCSSDDDGTSVVFRNRKPLIRCAPQYQKSIKKEINNQPIELSKMDAPSKENLPIVLNSETFSELSDADDPDIKIKRRKGRTAENILQKLLKDVSRSNIGPKVYMENVVPEESDVFVLPEFFTDGDIDVEDFSSTIDVEEHSLGLEQKISTFV